MLGAVISPFVLEQIKQEKITHGTWISLYAGEQISIQLNSTSLKINGMQLTTWLREDRNEKFNTAYGVEGETVLSKVTIDCNSLLVTVHEQHAYNKTMSLVKSVKITTNMSAPLGAAELISVVTVCQIPIDDFKKENNGIPNENKHLNAII